MGHVLAKALSLICPQQAQSRGRRDARGAGKVSESPLRRACSNGGEAS